MRIFRTAVLVFALLCLPLSMAHAATAYELLYTGLCLPLGSASETVACQKYWVGRIAEGRTKNESLSLCREFCPILYPVTASSDHAACLATCDNQRHNADQ